MILFIIINVIIFLHYVFGNNITENFKSIQDYHIVTNKPDRKNKFLIFSSVGDNSRHKLWLDDCKKKKFDVVLYYYGKKKTMPNMSNDIMMVIKKPGLKLENFYHFYKRFKEIVNKYEYIWIVDDDIQINTLDINRMFNLCKKYRLNMAQPSFCEGSNTSWDITKNIPYNAKDYSDVRLTNFIENGVPVIKTKVLNKIIHTFKDAKTGWGVDFIWCKLLNFKKIGIIHKVCVKHPHRKSEIDEIVPRDMHATYGSKLMKRYNVKEYIVKYLD